MANHRNNHYGFVFFIVTLGNLSLCYAQEAVILKKEETTGNAQTSMPMISNQKLSVCSEKAFEFDIKNRHLKEQQKTLEDLKMHRNELEQSRYSALKQLDLKDQNLVNQYNNLNRELNQVVNDLKSQAVQYNQEVEQYQNNIQELKNECDNKLYYSE